VSAQFSEFGFTEEKLQIRRSTHHDAYHQHIPYIAVGHREIPRLMDITNHPARVYLGHEKQSKKEVLEVDRDGVYNSFDAKKFLDLGVAPLQRIINELRNLSTESAEEHYDHRAVKTSGLPGYCDYIREHNGMKRTTKDAMKR
jgi:hypothetical protein